MNAANSATRTIGMKNSTAWDVEEVDAVSVALIAAGGLVAVDEEFAGEADTEVDADTEVNAAVELAEGGRVVVVAEDEAVARPLLVVAGAPDLIGRRVGAADVAIGAVDGGAACAGLTSIVPAISKMAGGLFGGGKPCDCTRTMYWVTWQFSPVPEPVHPVVWSVLTSTSRVPACQPPAAGTQVQALFSNEQVPLAEAAEAPSAELPNWVKSAPIKIVAMLPTSGEFEAITASTFSVPEPWVKT
jgi:hypothetical protein